MNKIKLILFVLVASVGAYSNPAAAFCPIVDPPVFGQVTEYFDAGTDRFFLSWREQLPQQSCTPGVQFLVEPPPADTLRTGLAWKAFTTLDGCGALCQNARFLCRFESDAASGPSSLLLTIEESECESLKQPGSGWTFLPDRAPGGITGSPRLAALPFDAASAACPSGIPVYRFFNNRSRERLANFRYVTDEQVRAEMRSRASWTEEGVAFCVYDGQRSAIAQQSQTFERHNCHGAPFGDLSCVDAVNMPLPLESQGPFRVNSSIGIPLPAGFYERTGAATPFIFTLPAESIALAATKSFLQFYDSPSVTSGAGFFVSSADRFSGSVSGLSTRSSLPDGLRQPFLAAYDVEMDLALSFQPFVKSIRTTGEDSQAFLFAEIVFADGTSGKTIELEIYAIGTPVVGDFVGAYSDGNVLAAFALGPTMTIGRSVGLPMLRTSRTFDAVNGWGYGGDFGYRINRTEFERLLQRARTVQPLLSADGRDYRVESFSFKGQVALTAEIGYNLQRSELSLVRP